VIDGEGVERFWSSVGGAAIHAEKQNVSHFAETYGDIFGLENAKAMVCIPSLLARKAQRAFSAFVMKLQQLVDYTAEIETSYNVTVTGERIKAWADKVDANPSGDPSAYLRVQAQLYGVLDELEAKRNVLSSLIRAQLFGSAEEADLIKKTKRKIAMLEKRARVLQLQAGIDYQPCSKDAAEFRQATAVHLATQVIDLEARVLIAQGSVQRGKNSMRILHAKEKSANRKTVERLRIALEEVQAKQLLNLSTMSLSSDASIDSEGDLPTIVMLKLVEPYHALMRFSEALGYQLRNELDCYIRTCQDRAGALRDAAADLDLSTRLGLGKRALFQQRAAFFEAMATNGTEVGTCFPCLPPLDATTIRRFPWISEVIAQASSPLETTLLSKHQCGPSCACVESEMLLPPYLGGASSGYDVSAGLLVRPADPAAEPLEMNVSLFLISAELHCHCDANAIS